MGKRRNLLQQIKACAKNFRKKKGGRDQQRSTQKNRCRRDAKEDCSPEARKKVPEEKSAGCAETVFVFTAKKRGAKTEELIFCPKAGIASNEKSSSERSEPFDSVSAAACFSSATAFCASLCPPAFAPAWKNAVSSSKTNKQRSFCIFLKVQNHCRAL